MPSGTVTLLDAQHVTWTTQLVAEVCCNCHIPFAMPRSLMDAARDDPEIWFYCPAGHRQHYTTDKLAEARKKITRLTADLDRERAALTHQRGLTETAQRSAAAYKGHAHRMQKRIGRGVCPCCNRYFADVDRHMGNKHPDFVSGQDPVQ